MACPTPGVRSEAVPVARTGSRFTPYFEDPLGWLATTMDKKALRCLVRVDWDTAGRIINGGLDPDRLNGLLVVGVDEVY